MEHTAAILTHRGLRISVIVLGTHLHTTDASYTSHPGILHRDMCTRSDWIGISRYTRYISRVSAKSTAVTVPIALQTRRNVRNLVNIQSVPHHVTPSISIHIPTDHPRVWRAIYM